MILVLVPRIQFLLGKNYPRNDTTFRCINTGEKLRQVTTIF